MFMGIISYIRVSTGKQAKSGLGLEAQRAAIARFAEAEGLEVTASSSRSRPAREPMRSTSARSWRRRWPRPGSTSAR